MTKLTFEHDHDDPDEEAEEDYFDDLGLLGDDEFEDSAALAEIRGKHPGWHIVKMTGFTFRQLADTEEWLNENAHHSYEKFGFRSGCAYMVGVAFENVKDAIYYKLRWR